MHPNEGNPPITAACGRESDPSRTFSIALLLDLDGTLADTSPDILRSLAHALRKFGHADYDERDLRSWVGEGSLALASQVDRLNGWNHPRQRLNELAEELDGHYLSSPTEGTFLLPGAIDLLDAAGKMGAFRAIYSNKPQAAREKLLADLEVIDKFEAILGAGSLPLKPDPAGLIRLLKTAGVERDKCLFIGDTGVDASAAEAAGCNFLFVDSGFRPPGELGRWDCISSLALAIDRLRALQA